MSCLHERTKSPAVISCASPSTASSGAPDAQRQADQAKPRVGLAQERQLLAALGLRQALAGAAHLRQRALHRARGHRRADVVGAARLVDQGRHHRGQLGGREVVPDPGAQALDDEQVGLAVDPGELPAGRR